MGLFRGVKRGVSAPAEGCGFLIGLIIFVLVVLAIFLSLGGL